MIIADPCYLEMIESPARSIKARVELYEGSTLLDTFTYDGALQNYTIDRIGEESKFFGYGICQKLTVKLRDKDRAINIVKGQGLEVVVGVGCEYLYPSPIFFVDEINRDENNNNLTIVAYDAIYEATKHSVSELDLPTSYNIRTFANACAGLLGMPMKVENENLIKYPYINTGRELYGLTFTVNNDGSFYVDGTSTVNFANYIFQNITLPAGVYSFDFLTDSVGGMGVLHDGTTYYTTRGTFTLSQTTELRVYFQVNVSGTTFNKALVKPILVKGNVIPTSFYPYLTAFDTVYPTGANFSGQETIRDALDDVAEATQTIYYMNNNWELTFKRLDKDSGPVLTIDKSKYFMLKSKTSHTLETIVSSTELGDDVYATSGKDGNKQFVRDNPFWNLRDDIDILLQDAVAAVAGTTITQFDCKWRGNFLLEVGDKIAIVTKDNKLITSYLLNDVLTYSGGLIETTKWSFIDNSAESMGNPVTIGESIKQTYAKVDKASKKIDLVAAETSSNGDAIASLQLTTDNISASVSTVEKNIDNQINGVNGEIDSLRKEVSTKMTEEDLTIKISQELANGVNKVVTETGFVFDNEGLTVSKSGSEMTTQITEDGMTVYRDNTAVLTANNIGVDAVNLHATTYLIIGTNSRFEDFGSDRTGCFWIGG